MKRYIIEGNDADVERVLQENRIRVERGVIKFTPAQPETVYRTDEKTCDCADSKYVEVEDSKTPKKRCKKSE